MTRREILIEMARRFEDAQNVLGGRGDSSGERLPLMPLTWNASFREFERCLRVLREERKSMYRHFHARYISPSQMIVELRFKKTIKGIVPMIPRGSRMEVVAGAPRIGEQADRFRVLVWPDWVEQLLVEGALDALEQEFRGEPFLPEEFRAA